MEIEMLKGKIHRATVTQAELDYVGSITVDEALLGAAGIREYQKVQVVNISNGNRIETYTIDGEKDSGVICLNGAAARHFSPNDLVIIMAYASYNEKDLENYSPKVVFVDDKNKIKKISSYEKHGRLS
ncbi:MAG: aspartate 1-decarboxylase [Anaerococcus vaginalis]|uniref:aspartate 1-decarboxylase n=1 Tax=Anaerococcus vaginalis TaxID=33037 RepID=UPI001DAC65C6|nr:aspartate 1-decarboxylase [Anaerococcus vaginalis]MBS4889307.1 aspartate 1-decarboxylase [Anaerococcus vaginalis]